MSSEEALSKVGGTLKYYMEMRIQLLTIGFMVLKV